MIRASLLAAAVALVLAGCSDDTPDQGADAAAPIVMRLIDHYLGSKGADGEISRRRAPGVAPPLPGERERMRQAEIEDGL